MGPAACSIRVCRIHTRPPVDFSHGPDADHDVQYPARPTWTGEPLVQAPRTRTRRDPPLRPHLLGLRKSSRINSTSSLGIPGPRRDRRPRYGGRLTGTMHRSSSTAERSSPRRAATSGWPGSPMGTRTGDGMRPCRGSAPGRSATAGRARRFVVSTPISTRPASSARLQSARLLVSPASPSSPSRASCGDLNAERDFRGGTAVLRRAGFRDTSATCIPTTSLHVSRVPRPRGADLGKIDYILGDARVGRRLGRSRSRCRGGRYPSDHFPVARNRLRRKRAGSLAHEGGGCHRRPGGAIARLRPRREPVSERSPIARACTCSATGDGRVSSRRQGAEHPEAGRELLRRSRPGSQPARKR